MYHGERFNGYTHMAGAVLAAAGATVLIAMASMKGDPLRVATFAVYGSTLCLLYLASTLYHCSQGSAKALFRKLDHCSIYLLIAGTYTPFALVTLNDEYGWTMLAAVWAIGLVGIVQELWIARGARHTSLAIYLVMGWLAVLALLPVAQSWHGLGWLAGGGLVYTFGIVFYLYDDRFPHWHGIWHLFVLVGSAVHFAAILKFLA